MILPAKEPEVGALNLAERERKYLPAYFTLAYLISWVFWGSLALSQQGLIDWEAPRVFFLLGGFGPIAAALLLTGRSLGWGGVRALLARLFCWRVGWRWYPITVLWPAAVGALAVAFLLWVVGAELEVGIASITAILVGLALTTLILVVEEVGWRGYALPRLQSIQGALKATLILGALWGLWHLPLHFLPNFPRPVEHPLLSVAVHTVFIIFVSVLLTWIFNSTGGSLLLVTLAHAAFNNTNMRALVVTPQRPVTLVGLVILGLFVLWIVWRYGAERLSRKERVTVADIYRDVELAA